MLLVNGYMNMDVWIYVCVDTLASIASNINFPREEITQKLNGYGHRIYLETQKAIASPYIILYLNSNRYLTS